MREFSLTASPACIPRLDLHIHPRREAREAVRQVAPVPGYGPLAEPSHASLPRS